MAYDIVFVEKPEPGRARGADSVFLSDLPTNPKVCAFFYRGAADTSEVSSLSNRCSGV